VESHTAPFPNSLTTSVRQEVHIGTCSDRQMVGYVAPLLGKRSEHGLHMRIRGSGGRVAPGLIRLASQPARSAWIRLRGSPCGQRCPVSQRQSVLSSTCRSRASFLRDNPVHNGGLVHTNAQRNLFLQKPEIQSPFGNVASDRLELHWTSFIHRLSGRQKGRTLLRRSGPAIHTLCFPQHTLRSSYSWGRKAPDMARMFEYR
jgi:hypothetical protein